MGDIDDNGVSLRDFINENKDLLSAMAVLIAVATFMKDLPIHWIASCLFFLAIAGVVIIWFELQAQFPKKTQIRLFLFKPVLSLGLIGFIFYWFLAFPTFWNIFSFIPLTVLLTAMFIKVLNQLQSFALIRRVFGEKGKRNIGQRVLVVGYNFGVFVAVSWILYICINASPAFNYMLELVRLNFH